MVRKKSSWLHSLSKNGQALNDQRRLNTACKICQTNYPSLSRSFPTRKNMTSPEISFTPEDLSSPENFASKLLREANSISQAKFKKSIQQVIEETPKSRLEQSAKKRRHGCTSSSLNIDKEQLMSEACTWQPDENINWSELGCRYGLHTANRGQIIKEYLAEQGILIRQRLLDKHENLGIIQQPPR